MMIKYTVRVGCLLLVVCSLVVSSASAADKKKKSRFGLFSNVGSSVGSAVDDAHESVSSSFKGFVVQVDDFIASEDSAKTKNSSWARVRLDTIRGDDGETSLKAKVKLRLVLPRSERRFRLLLSTGDDQSVAGTEATQQSSSDNDDISLALRFLRRARERSSIKFDVGLRWRDEKLQAFGRIGASVSKDLNKDWDLVVSNDYYHYSASGFDNRLTFNTSRKLLSKEDLYFRNTTELRWFKGLRGAKIGTVTGFYADRGPKAAYAFEVLANATTALDPETLEYYQGTELRLRIRRNAFRPWLYFEVWPGVSWAAINNYSHAYVGRVRVEATFGR